MDVNLRRLIADGDEQTVDTLINIMTITKKLYSLTEKEIKFLERIMNDEDYRDISMIKMGIV